MNQAKSLPNAQSLSCYNDNVEKDDTENPHQQQNDHTKVYKPTLPTSSIATQSFSNSTYSEKTFNLSKTVSDKATKQKHPDSKVKNIKQIRTPFSEIQNLQSAKTLKPHRAIPIRNRKASRLQPTSRSSALLLNYSSTHNAPKYNRLQYNVSQHSKQASYLSSGLKSFTSILVPCKPPRSRQTPVTFTNSTKATTSSSQFPTTTKPPDSDVAQLWDLVRATVAHLSFNVSTSSITSRQDIAMPFEHGLPDIIPKSLNIPNSNDAIVTRRKKLELNGNDFHGETLFGPKLGEQVAKTVADRIAQQIQTDPTQLQRLIEHFFFSERIHAGLTPLSRRDEVTSRSLPSTQSSTPLLGGERPENDGPPENAGLSQSTPADTVFPPLPSTRPSTPSLPDEFLENGWSSEILGSFQLKPADDVNPLSSSTRPSTSLPSKSLENRRSSDNAELFQSESADNVNPLSSLLLSQMSLQCVSGLFEEEKKLLPSIEQKVNTTLSFGLASYSTFSKNTKFPRAYLEGTIPHLMVDGRDLYADFLRVLFLPEGSSELHFGRRSWARYAQYTITQQLLIDRAQEDETKAVISKSVHYFGFIISGSIVEVWEMWPIRRSQIPHPRSIPQHQVLLSERSAQSQTSSSVSKQGSQWGQQSVPPEAKRRPVPPTRQSQTSSGTSHKGSQEKELPLSLWPCRISALGRVDLSDADDVHLFSAFNNVVMRWGQAMHCAPEAENLHRLCWLKLRSKPDKQKVDQMREHWSS